MGHGPQSSCPPQPSPAGPHSMLCAGAGERRARAAAALVRRARAAVRLPAAAHLTRRTRAALETPPQPSAAGPQLSTRSCAGLRHAAALPHTPGVPPPPQVGRGQVPHSRRPPQPSPAGPHVDALLRAAVGVQVGAPQTPGMPPPPQVWPAGRCRSRAGRRSRRRRAAVGAGLRAAGPRHAGCRRTRLGDAPPPQVWGGGRSPHSRTPPQPSPAGPQFDAACAHVLACTSGADGMSGSTHEARSKSMNSSTFSCGVSGARRCTRVGKRDVLVAAASLTWKSLKSTRPHCFAAGVPTGVLNV